MFMRLTVLGCNGPYPAPEGACSGYLVEAEGAALQLDLGSGVLARLTGRMPPEELTALLFSHWHGDHCSDLLPLIYRLGSVAQRLGGEALVTPTDPEEGDIARAVDAARGHSALVLGTYNAHVKRGQLRLLAALAGLGLPMACVALRDPYDLTALPENVYGLAAYEYNIESLDTVAQALTGAFVPAGKLPVPLEGGQP